MEPILIPPNCLYQLLEKKDLDPTDKLSDDEWEEFVKTQKDGFSEEGSKLGIQFLRYWISDGHLEIFREMKKKEREVKSLRKLLDDNQKIVNYGGSDMKKYCMIVKTESYSGINLKVDDDFDEDYDSLVLKNGNKRNYF